MEKNEKVNKLTRNPALDLFIKIGAPLREGTSIPRTAAFGKASPGVIAFTTFPRIGRDLTGAERIVGVGNDAGSRQATGSNAALLSLLLLLLPLLLGLLLTLGVETFSGGRLSGSEITYEQDSGEA